MIKGRAAGVAALATALAVSGCMGSRGTGSAAPTTQQVRQTVVTAPADLQLICASRAAEQFGAPADQVLPTSSQQTTAGTYQVVLTIPGGAANCVIDDNATVSSLERAA
ncbi:MAG: hypothetical protein AAGF49_16315 [Pseudomonadota bacterium]